MTRKCGRCGRDRRGFRGDDSPGAAIRSHLLVAFAITGTLANDSPVSGQSTYRPTVVIRSADQFAMLSGESTVVVYGRDGLRLRVFNVPHLIDELELSADETVIRIASTKGPDNYFDVQSGASRNIKQFLASAPPKQPKYRTNSSRPFIGRLQVIEAATERRVRILDEVRVVGPERWSRDGTVDIPVGVFRNGDIGVAAYRFNSVTGELRELFWFPGSFEFAQHMAFDPDRGYGVITSHDFEASLIDLQTGKCLMTISHKTPPPPQPSSLIRCGGSPTPATAVGVLLGVGCLGVLVVLMKFSRAVWRAIQRQMVIDPTKVPEASDYQELDGRP